MAKQQLTPPAPSMRIYWWSFGITLAVLVVIGVVYLMLSSSDLPSNFDESELPQLPGESGFSSDVPPLPRSAIEQETQKTPPSGSDSLGGGSADTAFSGSWKVYSQRLFYDEGGGGTTLSASSGTATTQTLSLKNDGSWTYGDSTGTWKVSAINTDDWTAWKIDSYGPTRKIVLQGWNKGTASGPVEEEAGTVNFVWVLYRTGPPTVSKPGTVNMKFGH